MNRYPRNPLWLLCALAALALGLAACGGDEPAAVAAPPAPPPAPPPFQPQPVEVALGDNGGTATLMTTEAGGFTLNGEAFTGGADAPVEGEGGRMYVLTLADGTWSAAFQPMEITVALGASEESATLMTTEAGGFTLGGEDFASGGSAMTEAGASYTLTLGEDGMWSAAFAPMEITVALGASEESATLWTTEAGGFTLDGEDFASGGSAMTEAGASYTLTLGEDGMWSAAFAPMEVSVTLGASGDTATLWTTEAGGFTLGGEAFESGGTAMSSNGGSYTLTRGADGAWAAAFVPVTRTVTLGTSGSSVDLVTDEAGGYTVGGEAFASGGRYTVGGLTYTLSLADGEWSAAFVPVTRTVTLGASGSAVTLSSTEAGGWAIGSSAVESGATQQADNGNRYTLTLAADGSWSAAFLPMKVSARLGGSGEVADLWTTEAMGVTLNGQAVESGATTTTNTAGETYVLSLADGSWSGAHRPRSSSVDLGASEESVTLATNEAGRWTLDGAAVSSGRTTVQSAADNAATEAKNEYVLTLAADGSSWTAVYRPATMPVEGTGLTASANEDGSGYTLGTGDDAPSLDASGAGTVTVDGAMFRVIKDSDDMLQGTRFDNDIAGSVMKVDTIGTTAAPGLLADNAKTDLNEKNTALEFHTADFSMGDLLGAGVATAEGDNIVAKARADMAKIRDRVAGLVALKQDGGLDGPALTTQLLRQWVAADGVINDVFGGTGEGRLERTTSESRVLDAFDRLVDALSSESAFAAATLANGPDKLQGFDNRTAAQAAQAFGRVKSVSTARLGALGSTRFGAAVWNETGNAKAGHATPERAQAFAWSTMLQTRRSNDVRVSGSANYQGRTHAADDDGNLYAGAIDINVRFTRGTVDGRVDGLERADTGNPFVYGLGGAVTGIVLPTARLNARAEWSVTTPANSSSPGRLQYAAQAGGQPDFNLSQGSTFEGRLLGRGDQAGAEAIGTWKAVAGSTTLAGGFGAARGADTEPPGAAVTGDLASIGKTGSTWARLERKPATVAARVSNPDATPPVTVAAADVRPALNSPNVLNTGNAKFNFVPQPPDTPAGHPNGQGDEYVVGNYTPDRAAVLEDQDWEATKGNWVADARAEIVKKLAQLRRSIALDGADASDSDTQFANDQRQRLFTEIQNELKTIFGPGRAASGGDSEIYTGVLTRETTRDPSDGWTAHVDYPVNSAGVAQDAAVLAEIEDVIEALASADAFARALADGGLFAATRTGSADLFTNGYPGAGAIFGRARGKLLIAADDTAYTRLGAWRHQISEHAADALSTQNYPRGDRGLELGSFAYSPLGPTAAYSDANNRLYPASGAAGTVSATYAGKTVAAQNDLFYRGDVEARVYWSPTTVADSEITIEISDLEETVTGDTLQVGNRVAVSQTDDTPRPGLKDVESLTWRLDITNSGTVQFSSGANSVRVGVSVNSLNEDPFRPAHNDQLRLTRVWTGSAQNDYRFGTSTDYWVLQGDGEGAGTDTEDDFGELSLHGVVVGGATERAPTAEELTQFTADVAALKYPKYVIGGPQIRLNDDSEPLTNSNIFMFADGSLLHYGEPDTGGGTNVLTAPQALAIGVTGGPAANTIKASAAPMTPLLSANDGQYLWTHTGYGKTTYPTSASGGEAPGVGAPAMTPDAIFEAFVRAGDYVNVRGTDAELASKIKGMFVGQDQDGPLGIIGTWELSGGIFGTEDERGIIRGAFGADIQP